MSSQEATKQDSKLKQNSSYYYMNRSISSISTNSEAARFSSCHIIYILTHEFPRCRVAAPRSHNFSGGIQQFIRRFSGYSRGIFVS
jgi:hypothetical protein